MIITNYYYNSKLAKKEAMKCPFISKATRPAVMKFLAKY